MGFYNSHRLSFPSPHSCPHFYVSITLLLGHARDNTDFDRLDKNFRNSMEPVRNGHTRVNQEIQVPASARSLSAVRFLPAGLALRLVGKGTGDIRRRHGPVVAEGHNGKDFFG